jgi:hypothetical protein
MELDYTEKNGRDAFRNIMKCIDPKNTQIVAKADVIDFFSLPNFL